ncbi:hypothetical protein [Bacillus sp. FSL K6-3431]|uniref:hypothetical protein n=1 Tax=Bacillus sp. FSL K6-3431 TaxID=2921500 RepID=UPI0030F8556A
MRKKLAAAPPPPFVVVTSIHWRTFIPSVAATTASAIMPISSITTTASAIMTTMSSLAAALRELLDLLQYFFKHFLPLFIRFLERVVFVLFSLA